MASVKQELLDGMSEANLGELGHCWPTLQQVVSQAGRSYLMLIRVGGVSLCSL